MDDYGYDLGGYRREVSTDSPEAQTWFDRGLNWCYGFHHEEAIACFERALAADPGCAMAHWGIAYAIGPNYNKPWEAFDPEDLQQSLARAHAATLAARERAGEATPVERALIEALPVHFPSDAPVEDCAVWDPPYAEAMRSVYRAFPEDPDVSALFAEALMNITPWELWDLASGEIAQGAHTAEAMEVLERAIARSDTAGTAHPGLLHLYVHLLEMSPHPERALKAADQLRDLVPDSGHLRHMPTHIDVLCGHYRTVVECNQRAIVADRKYLEREGALNFYSAYRSHNYHFKIYGAMFMGQFGPAMEAAEELIETLPEDLLRMGSPPMADWLEAFVPMKQHVLIRFGRWRDILAQPFPEDRALFCVTTAMLHYARAVAHAVLEEVPEAEAEAARFQQARAAVPESRTLFNNACADILAVASEMMSGEIAYRKGEHERGFAHLRQAVALDDALPYDEPWGWMQPTRHALGALLLEQDRVQEAEAVYRADLGLDATLSRACQHPENVWALHGFHECLTRLGKEAEAALVKPRLELALARTDVPVTASCLCRLQCCS